MQGVLFKGSVFVSSYIPAFIMIFLNNLKSFNKKDVENVWNSYKYFWISLIIIGFISLISLLIWLKLIQNEGQDQTQKKYKVHKIKKYDSEILGYFVTYIIPILSLNPASAPSIAMNLILIAIEGIYYISNNILYFNIIILILGFHLYSVDDDDFIIISKKEKAKIDLNELVQIGTTQILYC